MSRMRVENQQAQSPGKRSGLGGHTGASSRSLLQSLSITLILLASVTGSGNAQAVETCLTDSSQSDFQAGLPNMLDLLPAGDVQLTMQNTIDQQNIAITANGYTFHSYWWVGQTFVAGVSGPLTAVDLRLFCNACTGTTPDILVSIRETSGGVPTGEDLATAVIPGFASASGGWKKAIFPSPIHMNSGTQYAILARAVEQLSAGTYAYLVSDSDGAYSAGGRLTSTNNGLSFEPRSYDIGFKVYSGGGFVPGGDLLSSLKNGTPSGGGPVKWTQLSWNSSEMPETGIKFQVAASSSSTGPFFPVGPDGTGSTFFTTSAASLSQFDGKPYLRYKAFLSSANTSKTPSLHDVEVCFEQGSGEADLSITNTDGVSAVAPGGSVSYTIVASNAGPGNVTSATVTDNFSSKHENCSWTCSSAGGGSCAAAGSGSISQSVNLPAGGSATFVAQCDVKASATGSLVNTATVSSATADPNASNNSATDTDSLSASADLEISVDNEVTSVIGGDEVIYTIIASNHGPSPVGSATVSNPFSSKLQNCEWLCDASPGASCAAAGVGNINQVVNLPVGSNTTFTAICNVDTSATSGSLVNTASVSSATADPVSENNSDTDTDSLMGISDLAVSLDSSLSHAQPGSPVNYTIVASNAGLSSASQVTVTDNFPAGLNNCSWTCSGSGGGSCPASGSGNINHVINLPAGASATFSANCTIAAEATGTVENIAEVSCEMDDPDLDNNSASKSTVIGTDLIFKNSFD